MNLRNKSVKGFTLTELIVVIAIIGVLTATVVISVGAFIRDNKFNDANSKAETLYRALQIKLNQYDAEGHTFIDPSTGARVEGIGGIYRSTTSGQYLYIGNGMNFTNIGQAYWFFDLSGNIDSASTAVAAGNVVDFPSAVLDEFNMEDAIHSVCNQSRLSQNTPSWLAKIDMKSYTVCYVLYTEDRYALTDSTSGFLDKAAGGADNNGYYLDYDEQQSTTERALRDQAIIGCYPIQAFSN